MVGGIGGVFTERDGGVEGLSGRAAAVGGD